MTTTEPSRRERYRQQTLDEIKAAAVEQVSAGGVEAVSLNAIARSMGMSPPALYRYFASRDDLLAELVVDSYGSLADALEAAAGTGSAVSRFTGVADAYRNWALANPNAYRMIFEHASGSGRELAPERVVPAAQRSMDVFLAAVAGAGSGHQPASAIAPGLGRALVKAIRAWGQRTQQPTAPAPVLYLGLASWSRLHGLISLEINGHLHATGIDAGLLYHAEVQALLAQAQLAQV